MNFIIVISVIIVRAYKLRIFFTLNFHVFACLGKLYLEMFLLNYTMQLFFLEIILTNLMKIDFKMYENLPTVFILCQLFFCFAIIRSNISYGNIVLNSVRGNNLDLKFGLCNLE